MPCPPVARVIEVRTDGEREAIEPAMRAALRAYEVAGNVEAHYFLSQALKATSPQRRSNP